MIVGATGYWAGGGDREESASWWLRRRKVTRWSVLCGIVPGEKGRSHVSRRGTPGGRGTADLSSEAEVDGASAVNGDLLLI